MAITIFSNKSVIFNHPKDYEVTAQAQVLEFSSVPDWVVDSKMFKLLKKEGSVRVIESNKDLKNLELEGKIAKEAMNVEVKEEVESVEIEKEIEDTVVGENSGEVDLNQLSAKELYNLCIEKEIEVEAKQRKDVYLEALLNNQE